MRVVVLSKYFQEYYHRKLETKNRVGQQPKRKEILCAVAIKPIAPPTASSVQRKTVLCFHSYRHVHQSAYNMISFNEYHVKYCILVKKNDLLLFNKLISSR
jgi:hypothetical protein